jgi:hypothetical protein
MRILTRDSPLWNTLMTIGGIVSVVAITIQNPSEYGLSPIVLKWIQLVGVAFTAAGKLGTSPLPHAEEGDAKITLSGK